jgi:hypothetical protein
MPERPCRRTVSKPQSTGSAVRPFDGTLRLMVNEARDWAKPEATAFVTATLGR